MKTIHDYEDAIKDYHTQLSVLPEYHPDYVKIEGQLFRQISKWADMVDVTIFVAKNEQAPYTEEEMGYPILPIPLKSKSGYQQVGDYLFQVNGIMSSIVIERKGVTRKNGRMIGCDLYSTLFNKSNRERFKKEFYEV